MKNLTLALFVLITICIVACKKKVDPIMSTPTPSSTTDFRDKYTGTFEITSTVKNYAHPSSGPADSSITTSSYTVTISYNITDSLTYISPLPTITWPALTFTKSSGSKEIMGIDSTGKLIRFSTYHSYGGGFVTLDSINHSATQSHTTTTTTYILTGHRL
jgi:hypothetical protein